MDTCSSVLELYLVLHVVLRCWEQIACSLRFQGWCWLTQGYSGRLSTLQRVILRECCIIEHPCGEGIRLISHPFQRGYTCSSGTNSFLQLQCFVLSMSSGEVFTRKKQKFACLTFATWRPQEGKELYALVIQVSSLTMWDFKKVGSAGEGWRPGGVCRKGWDLQCSFRRFQGLPQFGAEAEAGSGRQLTCCFA